MVSAHIPFSAAMVYDENWGGWTWFSKDRQTFKITRYLAYRGVGDETYHTVWFTREECYEQFKDDLEEVYQKRAEQLRGFGDIVSETSAYTHGSLSRLPRDPKDDH